MPGERKIFLPNKNQSLLPNVLHRLKSLQENWLSPNSFTIGKKREYTVEFMPLSYGFFLVTHPNRKNHVFPALKITSDFRLVEDKLELVKKNDVIRQPSPLTLSVIVDENKEYVFEYLPDGSDSGNKRCDMVKAYVVDKKLSSAAKPLTVDEVEYLTHNLGVVIPKSIDGKRTLIRLLNRLNHDDQVLSVNEFKTNPLVEYDDPDADARAAAKDQVLF